YGPILERVGCLHTQTGLQSPRRNRSPPKGCGYRTIATVPPRSRPSAFTTFQLLSTPADPGFWLYSLARPPGRRPEGQPAYISMPIVKRYCQYEKGTPLSWGTGSAKFSGLRTRQNTRDTFHSSPKGLRPA